MQNRILERNIIFLLNIIEVKSIAYKIAIK